jgi:hypothetical protein
MSNDLIVMDNSIVTSAYNLTLNEQRLIYCALKQIPKGEPIDPETTFYVSRDDFLELGADTSNVAQEIRQATRDLMKKTLKIRTNAGVLEFQWLRQVLRYDKNAEQKLKEMYPNKEYYNDYIRALKLYNLFDALPPHRHDDNIVARMIFSPEIVPLLSDLRANFTQFLVKDVAKFTSIYSFRIYQLLMQYKSTGYIKISIDDLRYMLVLQNKYPLVADLKKRAIDVAVDEINEKSPYNVQCEFIKKGRKFVALEMKFCLKDKEKTSEADIKTNQFTIDMDSLSDKEREVVAQKNAYADQINASVEHRHNLIKKGLETYREAEKVEAERQQAQLEAERQRQAQEQAEQLALEQAKQAEEERQRQRQIQLEMIFDGLTNEQRENVLDEVEKDYKHNMMFGWFKESRDKGTVHKDVRFRAKLYEIFGI